MRINLLTSKTVWGAILWVIGFLTSPETLALLPENVAAIIQSIGVILSAIGVRHAVAKSAKGVSQLHPATVILALLLTLACNGKDSPPPIVRDTVRDTIRVAGDTVYDTVEVRRIEPVNVTLSSLFLGDSSYTVRRIAVKPDSTQVKPGEQVQFCPYIVFGKGQDTALAGQWAIPAAYAKLPRCSDSLHFKPAALRWRRPDTVQKLIANHSCFEWAATGGTITAQPCQGAR